MWIKAEHKIHNVMRMDIKRSDRQWEIIKMCFDLFH